MAFVLILINLQTPKSMGKSGNLETVMIRNVSWARSLIGFVPGLSSDEQVSSFFVLRLLAFTPNCQRIYHLPFIDRLELFLPRTHLSEFLISLFVVFRLKQSQMRLVEFLCFRQQKSVS